MSLARAERRRLVKRRFTRYMLLIVVLVLAGIAVATFATNEKVGPEQIAAAERDAERDYQQQLRFHEQFVADCERQNRPDCSQMVPPQREQFSAEWYMPATFAFREDFPGTITIFASILALFAFVVGASYVGAEWNTGGMMNLLLWRPRRLTVLVTKLGTLLGALLVICVGLAAAWTAAFWGIASMRGNTERMTSGVWQSFALTGVRGVGLVLIAGAIGFGLASLGRHTAMALGLAVGAAVVGFIGVAITLEMVGVRFVQRWLWPSYLQAWMDKKFTVEDFESCQFSSIGGGCEPVTYDVTWQQSGVLFAVVTVAVMVAAMWTMRRRDIT